MLHFYAFRNFQSFAERVEFSLVLNNKVPTRGWETNSPSGQRISTALALMGANGAGKTAALKPLAFVDWFIKDSFSTSPDSVIPFFAHFAHGDAPTEIEIEADDAEGVVWRYVLRLKQTQVLHESLYRKRKRFSYVFERNWDALAERYVVKQQDFGMNPTEATKVRSNASLISTAWYLGVPIAAQIAALDVVTNITVLGRDGYRRSRIPTAAKVFGERNDLHDQMSGLLSGWDLGLGDVVVEEVPVTQDDGTEGTRWMAFGTHRARGRDIQLPMELESSGTQSAFMLLSRLLPILQSGGITVIDELDSDLHPHMLEPILDLFANPTTNPHQAQIIFTCHSSLILDLLQKSQVYLVEKTDCESVAYRADSIQGLRSDDNLRAKYLSGALGAVPKLG